MDGTMVRANQRSFGTVTLEEAGFLGWRPEDMRTTSKEPCRKYTWHPPEAILEQLPGGFQLSLACQTDADGLRRFYPWNSFETFLTLASAGGLAILSQRQNLSSNERHSYRAMRLLFLRVRHAVEFFGHNFRHNSDLSVTPSGRE